MIKKYALVAGLDVFYMLIMDESHPVAAKWIAAIESGVKFVQVDEYSQIRPGYLYKNGNLFAPSDIGMLNPLDKLPTKLERNQYAGIIDNEVVGMLTIDKKDNPNGMAEMIEAGISSDPKIVEYTNNPKHNLISVGWIYDGEDFNPPLELK